MVERTQNVQLDLDLLKFKGHKESAILIQSMISHS